MKLYAIEFCKKIVKAYEPGDIVSGCIGISGHSGKTFEPLGTLVNKWNCYFYVTDCWKVKPNFIADEGQIISKTSRKRLDGENTILRHYFAYLKRKTLGYSKSEQRLRHSVRLLIHASQICQYSNSISKSKKLFWFYAIAGVA